MKNLLPAALLGLAFLAFSCQPSDDPDAINPADKNVVTLEFDHRAGTQKLVMGTTYKNGSGEDYAVTMLNYFVSNVSLTKDDGTVVKFPDRYFLLRLADPKTHNLTLADVPAGNYKQVTFSVGVDSAKSVSSADALKGVLDPAAWADPMYWSWNSGYIFWRFEGTSPVIPASATGERIFNLHVGGFGGRTAPTPNNLRTVTLPVGAELAKVRSNIAPAVHLLVDVGKFFDGPTKISLAKTNQIHMPAAAVPLANNIATLFAVDHVHNDQE